MRSFKKIAAMIMAVAMLCSFTALAADVALLPVDDTDSDAPRVTLGYDWASTTAAQTTMVVYKNEVANGDVNEVANGDVVYINQFAAGASDVTLELGNEYGNYTVVAGGMDVDRAITETFSFTGLAYDVTINDGEAISGGRVVTEEGASLTGVLVGTKVALEFLPFVGYEVTTLEIDGEDKTNVVGKSGGKVEFTVTGAVEIEVAFTEAVATEETKAFTAAEIHDFVAVEGAENKDDQYASKLIFGKAVVAADQAITEAGMYLEVWSNEADDFIGFETATKTKVGPYFKADVTEGKFGIRFIRFNAGTYRVSSYVKLEDGSYKYGDAKEFIVD